MKVDPNKFARFSLLAAAIGFFGFGIVLFIAPGLMETAGVKIIDPAGSIEIRAFYGGVEMGLGMFFFIALRKKWILPGLSVQVLSNGFIVITRVIALAIEGFQAKPATWWSLAAELFILLLGIMAIRIFKSNKTHSNEGSFEHLHGE
ncbi:MAG: DUF4345 family protein [Candidatus Neomarinimicrobiota bacterium]|jgi:hypothetical protein